MKEFQLTVFRQNRILLVIFMMPVTLLTSLFVALELNHIEPLNLLISGLIIVLSGLGLFYISIGRLTVKVEDQTLKFSWTKKAFFNYKSIEPVQLSDIRTLVINEQILLKELQTDQRQIPIGTAKLMKKDATEFIDFLKTNTTAEQIDSWDVWKRRGWLAIAYRINTFILVIFGIIIISFISIKGFNSALLLYIPLVLFQLIGYQFVMKSKM